MTLVKYDSNNSGGSWWLTDDHWRKLEAAGWHVIWGGRYFCSGRFEIREVPSHKPRPCADVNNCPGHRIAETAQEAQQSRWLGCLACEAEKEFPSLRDGIKEWEEVTGLEASDEGCSCCGLLHAIGASLLLTILAFFYGRECRYCRQREKERQRAATEHANRLFGVPAKPPVAGSAEKE